jgi:hypothetical protein
LTERAKPVTGAVEAAVAVLIDADNTPHEAVKHILDASARFGRTIIKRAYGDWTTQVLQPWGGVFKEFGIKPIQQFQYTTGKNSTDIAMIIDTVDMLHQSRIDVFVLVTSDSDFTALATRVREEGPMVVGMGRMTTPSSFVKACDEFLPIEGMFALQTGVGPGKRNQSGASVEMTNETTEDGRDLLARAVKQAANSDGIVSGANLGVMLKRLDPKFSTLHYGVKRLTEFIALYPGVLTPTGEHAGLDPTYKIVAEKRPKKPGRTSNQS